MKIRLFAFALAASVGFTTVSHAATLGISLGNTNADIAYGAGPTLSPNIHLNSPAPATLVLNSNAQIVDPRQSLPDTYLDFQGPLLDNNFLAVLGGNETPGFATLTLAPSRTLFGFTWGSIDGFNTLAITDSRAVTYTITGADIISQIGNPPEGLATTQTDVSFSSLFGDIVSVQFVSSQNSFEVGNLSDTATPIPASLLLFGSGLAGLFGISRRNRNKA